VLNNPADVLSIVLRGTLGRSGRKRARRATRFLTGNRGFLSTSALIAAAGVAWGIYDTVRASTNTVPGVPPVPGVPGAGSAAVPPVPAATVPPIPAAIEAASASAAEGGYGVTSPKLASDLASEGGLDPVARVIRLAVSAAKADGALSDQERVLIMDRAREAGLESVVEAELAQTRPLADIVRGVTDPAMKKELYVLAFTIVRADETLSGAERIYLAQLAHQLGLDAAAVTAIENETATKIDAQSEADS
jgi:tellurite resistance protein